MFARHAGNQLKRFLGISHDGEVSYDDKYTYVEVGGKVAYRTDPMEDSTENLMILHPKEPIKIGRRSMVVVNPEVGMHTSYNCQYILEPGDTPTVYIHNFYGTYAEMDLDWLFRIYFIK